MGALAESSTVARFRHFCCFILSKKWRLKLVKQGYVREAHFRNARNSEQNCCCWAVVVAQLVERSLPKRAIRGLYLLSTVLNKTKIIKKWPGMAHL